MKGRRLGKEGWRGKREHKGGIQEWVEVRKGDMSIERWVREIGGGGGGLGVMDRRTYEGARRPGIGEVEDKRRLGVQVP